MNPTSAHSKDTRSTTTVVQELVHGIQNLVRGEIQLARAELNKTAQEMRRNFASTALFGSIALIGVLPLIAFFVIGLGKLLNDQYWLSSLIVAILFMGIGGAAAYYSAKKLKSQDFSLPQTRHSVQEESQVVRGRLREVTETFQRKAS